MKCVRGDVRELIEYYDPAERDDWRIGRRDGFPKDSRLAFNYNCERQPLYYFGETWWARKLMGDGHICWQERVHIFNRASPKSPWLEASSEFVHLLGEERAMMLQSLGARVAFPLKTPDVVAFHPTTKKWGFYEVKLDEDGVRLGQIQSLGLLSHVLGADVAVVRLEPSGKVRALRQHSYEFELAE